MNRLRASCNFQRNFQSFFKGRKKKKSHFHRLKFKNSKQSCGKTVNLRELADKNALSPVLVVWSLLSVTAYVFWSTEIEKQDNQS